MKLICLGPLIFFPAVVVAASMNVPPDARALREACSAYSQAGMRECLEKKVDDSRNALKRAEDQVASTLSNWDDDPKYVNLARARFAASARAFTKYRQEQCAFAAALGGGAIGNALDIMRLACIAELNGRRAVQLSHAVADLPLK